MKHGVRRSATRTDEYQYMLEHLRKARRAAGLTQVQVAEALARPQSYVTKCELGERRIDPRDRNFNPPNPSMCGVIGVVQRLQ